MKRILIILGIVALVLAVAFLVFMRQTKSHSPVATADYNQNGLEVRVEYCQPSKKDRVIFGGLVPYGQVWRTGANEATKISFNKDVLFAGKSVKAGTYTLFTIPGEKTWTVILNKETGQWGLAYNEKEDLLRAEIPAGTQPDLTEMFTIGFTGSGNAPEMHLVWDKTNVTVPIQAQ
jgi:hypothetical protein